MTRAEQIKALEAKKSQINAQINHLKINPLIAFGKRLGKSFSHSVQKHSFSNWKKNYMVLNRQDYELERRTAGQMMSRARDAKLRANNLKTNLR